MKSQTQVCEKEVCSVEEVNVSTWQTPPNEKASPGQIEALPKITCSFNFLDSWVQWVLVESVLQDRTRGKPQEVKPMASSRPILAAIHFLSCFSTFHPMTTHMRREDFKVFSCFKSISVALVHLWTLLFKETFNYQLFEGRCSVKDNKGRFWGLWEVIMGWRSGTQQRFQIDCRHNQPHIRAWMMLSVNICDTKNFSMCSGLVTTTAHCDSYGNQPTQLWQKQSLSEVLSFKWIPSQTLKLVLQFVAVKEMPVMNSVVSTTICSITCKSINSAMWFCA